MAKKNSMSLGKLVITIITIVLAVAICLPLFVNVWDKVFIIGSESKTMGLLGDNEIAGYFADYSGVITEYKFYHPDAVFMDWASVVAGIALIVALVGGVIYIVGAILSLVGGNKISAKLTKFGSAIMLIAGIVVLIASLLVVLPIAKNEIINTSVSATLGFGAWIGIFAPISAGILGLITSRK